MFDLCGRTLKVDGSILVPKSASLPAQRIRSCIVSRENSLPCIHASVPFAQAPQWAILERKLIDVMNQSVPAIVEKYVNPDGSIKWPPPGPKPHEGIDALDDAYESFHNWPLFYILGGDDYLLDLSLREYDAVTKQFENYETGHGYKMVEKEFCSGYDWMHNGEGYAFFYHLGLADPTNQENIERSKRYAGFYMGEDPEVDNFDTELKLIKSPHNGSTGPCPQHFPTDGTWTQEGYGLPFWDIDGATSVSAIYSDPEAMKRIGKAKHDRDKLGDTPVNLASTSLMANAFLYTGDQKYKSWIKDYFVAWEERTKENGGIIPDNIGLSGKIGEYNEGRWFGGNYGWVWPHGFETIGAALAIASENMTLLGHDTSYLGLFRSQIDELMKRGKHGDNALYVPHKYWSPETVNYDPWERLSVLRNADGTQYQEDGWFEYMIMDPAFGGHLWSASMAVDDLERIKKLRRENLDGWNNLSLYKVRQKDQSGHEYPWIAYLQGEYESYPVEKLNDSLRQAYDRMTFMREDTQAPMTFSDSYLQSRNPVNVEGLIQLTLGGPIPVYNGGLLMTRVRYFDNVRKRPGLPADVAALVKKLEDNRTVIELVNLSPIDTREVVVQGGAFGEHSFTTVKFNACVNGEDSLQTSEVNGKAFVVKLDPGATVTLDAATERFVNEPTYAFPW